MVWIENKEKEVSSPTMYETEKNREDELEVITRLMTVFNWTSYMKYPSSDIIDYSIIGKNNRICAVIEVKSRNHLITDFDTQFLKKNKLEDGLIKAKRFNCKFIYAIKTKDNNIYYVELTEKMQFEERLHKQIELDGFVSQITHKLIPTNLFQKLIENN